MDPAGKMVELAADRFRENPWCRYGRVREREYRSGDAYFDYVVCNLALHHVPPTAPCLPAEISGC